MDLLTAPTPVSTRRLSDVARHVVYPSGIVTTGWPAVRDTAERFGVRFEGGDAWEDGIGQLALAKRDDGLYAAGIGGIVLAIPRQVGKTFLVGAIVFALCLLEPGFTVLWTAHRLRTANELFRKMQGFSRRPKVSPYISRPRLGSGDQEIRFENGSRIMFGARERGFGRGFDDVDVEVFDEAQILTDKALDDMVPATNTARNPLLFFIGTPPTVDDPSDVFLRKRSEALEGSSDDTVFVEFSADRGCDPLDRAQWAKANPSFPGRTNEAAMLRMKKNLTPDAFMREALGVWDEVDTGGLAGRWRGLLDEDSVIASHRAIALEVSQDRRSASFGWAGRRADGLLHVEALPPPQGADLSSIQWVHAAAAAIFAKFRLPVRIVRGSPAASFIDPLREAGVEVEEIIQQDYAAAVGQIIVAGLADALRHRGEEDLALAVQSAELVASGAGDVWQRRRARGNITPLTAVTVAVGGVPAGAPSVYEERGMEVFG
jgi:hypothetical protein